MTRCSLNRISRIIALILVSSFCLILLCACNSIDDVDNDIIERDLYLAGISFAHVHQSDTDEADTASEGEETTAYIYLTFSQTDKKIDGATATWSSQAGEQNLWYSTSHTYIDVDSARLFSAVKDSIPQESLVLEDVECNRLKVIIEYDTIYKSIKSDGEIEVTGRTYVHYFTLDESLDNQRFTLSLTSAKSANWYSALLAGGIVIFVLATTIYLIAKGKLWQKKKTRE